MKSILCLFSLLFGLQAAIAQQESTSFKKGESLSFSARLEPFKKSIDRENINLGYNDVSDLWEEVAHHLKDLFHDVPDSEPSQSVNSMKDWQLEVSRRFTLLREVSRVRARYLDELKAQDLSLFSVDNRTLKRMGLEITLIPYKFLAYFYEKTFWVRSQLGKGFGGLYGLTLEFLILFAILFLPFVAVRLSRLVEIKIEEKKREFFYKSFQSKRHRLLTNLLPIVSEYLPWVFTYLTIKVIYKLLLFSEFQEFSNLLPYVYYFVYYKIFRVTLELLLREFASNLPQDSKENLNQKIQRTSRFLGVVLFGVYSLETAFQSILGPSLIFSIAEPFFGLVILALLFFVSARWEKEIEKYLKNTNIHIFQMYSKKMENRYSLFLSLPGLVLIFVHFSANHLASWSSQFDLVKLLYAKVLRVKYESTRDDSGGLNRVEETYRNQFLEHCKHPTETFVLEKDFFKKIEVQVQSWIENENTEQTVAIHGPKGSGKSIFLQQASDFFSEKKIRCEKVDVPARVFTEKSFDQVFEAVLSIPEEEKAIVFIDNAHNLFLSTIGGFQIYQAFLEKTEERKNIFWIAAYNEYSWQFLNSVLGENQYFRQELQLPKWSASEVKDMILGFHGELDYKTEYDQIFRSSQRLNEEVTSAENRYFYLIWERSNGNPGLAIYYWFRSLRLVSDKRVKVCLPFENPVSELAKLNQEMHFVYASLMKHENLNISEATRATHLPRAVVKQAIYRGVEEGFLIERSGRYCVGMDWIDDLKKYLKGKNLIYEVSG